MQVTIQKVGVGRLARMHFHRVVLWLAMAIFTLQLIGTSHHKHDLAEQSSDCVSCYFAAHFPSDIPVVSTEILTVLVIVAYQIVHLPLSSFVAAQHYLAPPSQAPPLAISPA